MQDTTVRMITLRSLPKRIWIGDLTLFLSHRAVGNQRPVSIVSASRVRTRNCILLRLRRCSDHLFGSSAIALSCHKG
jgi:hypothetical protein